MAIEFKRIEYKDLSAKLKETYNFQKLAGALADYGLTCLRVTEDWNGADVLLHCPRTLETSAVQLKGRFDVNKKYFNLGLLVAFREGNRWILFDHDRAADLLEKNDPTFANTSSWKDKGHYSIKSIGVERLAIIRPAIVLQIDD